MRKRRTTLRPSAESTFRHCWYYAVCGVCSPSLVVAFTQRSASAPSTETRAKVCGPTFILLTTGEGVGRSTLSLSLYNFGLLFFIFASITFRVYFAVSPLGFHKFRINREQAKYTKSSTHKRERREAEISCLVSSIVSAAVQSNLLSALNIAANCRVF